MSCNWRPERESVPRDDTFLELRGVKKRVNRLGVIGGGLFGFRVPPAAVCAGGDDENNSGVGS